MRKLLLFLLMFFAIFQMNAQDAAIKALKEDAEKGVKKEIPDTAHKTWKKGGTFSLNVNQGSLSNWSAGGDKFSFSLNAFFNTYLSYKKGRRSWDNNLDLNYGVINTTSLGHRKASDRIELTSKYGYALKQKLNLALLTNVRSQFARGYSYTEDVNGKDSASLTSKSFSPAYVLLSLGSDYKPNKDLSLFFSPLTGRWIIASDPLIGPLYGVAAGKKTKSEFGAFFSANYLKKISTNMTYKGKLDLFSNYRSKPQNIDVFLSNVLTAQISKYINFSLNLDIIYDDDTKNVNPQKGPEPQILQLMGIGFGYKFNK